MKNRKRIAFIDYELANWHADTYLRIFRNELKDREFEVTACHAMREKTGREWAQKNGLRYFADPRELDKNVDCYVVMAPSNPEKHLALSAMVFPFGKPTFVDKTFAPNAATAKKIFALADRYGTKIQTCSALRYTDIQAYVAKTGQTCVRHVAVWGGGGSFGEYAVHPVEIAVSCLGPRATRVMRRKDGEMSQLLVDFSGGRTAVVNVYCRTNTDFVAGVTTVKETKFITVDGGKLFVDAAAGMLDFFRAGKPHIDRAETMTIMRIIDAARNPRALSGFVRI
jgi:hypothetical protein